MKWMELQKGELFRLNTNEPKKFLEVEKYSDGTIEGRITLPDHGYVSKVGEYSSITSAKSSVMREAKKRGLVDAA